MSKNNGAGEPKHGAKGQSMAQSVGAGGANGPAKPFGMKTGSTKNAPSEPRHGACGQRLAGGGGKGATGYPPGYTSR